MIKLLALDMDGTLLNDQKEISPANIVAIQKAVDTGVKIGALYGPHPKRCQALF